MVNILPVFSYKNDTTKFVPIVIPLFGNLSLLVTSVDKKMIILN